MGMAKVAAIRCVPETVLTDVERLCDLAGMRDALRTNRTTILRSSVASRFPSPGVNTTPWQLDGAIGALRNAGYDAIVGVEGNVVTREADLNNYGPIFKKHDVDVLHVHDASDVASQAASLVKWVAFRPKGRMHVLPKMFPDGIRVPDFFFGKNVVHLPTMSTAPETTIRGAMASALGGLLQADRPAVHGSMHRVLVDLLAIQKEIHEGLFAIVDGTTMPSCADRASSPKPMVKGYLLAGADPVAVDAVAAKMMGFDPMTIESIRVAHDDKLGVGDPRDIAIVGDDVSKESWGLSVRSDAVAPIKRLERLAARTPLQSLLEAGSEAYRAYYRWPLREKRIFETWKKSTSWGALFGAYERGESERIMKARVEKNADAESDADAVARRAIASVA